MRVVLVSGVAGNDENCLLGDVAAVGVEQCAISIAGVEDLGGGDDGGNGGNAWSIELGIVDVKKGSAWQGRA